MRNPIEPNGGVVDFDGQNGVLLVAVDALLLHWVHAMNAILVRLIVRTDPHLIDVQFESQSRFLPKPIHQTFDAFGRQVFVAVAVRGQSELGRTGLDDLLVDVLSAELDGLLGLSRLVVHVLFDTCRDTADLEDGRADEENAVAVFDSTLAERAVAAGDGAAFEDEFLEIGRDWSQGMDFALQFVDGLTRLQTQSENPFVVNDVHFERFSGGRHLFQFEVTVVSETIVHVILRWLVFWIIFFQTMV